MAPLNNSLPTPIRPFLPGARARSPPAPGPRPHAAADAEADERGGEAPRPIGPGVARNERFTELWFCKTRERHLDLKKGCPGWRSLSGRNQPGDPDMEVQEASVTSMFCPSHSSWTEQWSLRSRKRERGRNHGRLYWGGPAGEFVLSCLFFLSPG